MSSNVSVENLNPPTTSESAPLIPSLNQSSLNQSSFKTNTLDFLTQLTPESPVVTSRINKPDESLVSDDEMETCERTSLFPSPNTQNNTFPNFNVDTAQQLYMEARDAYLVDVETVKKLPEPVFSEENFIVLHPHIRLLTEYTRKSFYTHMKTLYDDLTAGVHTAMQGYLIQSLVNKNLFWPGVAFHLGFTPPVLEIDDLGNKPAFLIPAAQARIKTAQRCNQFATEFKERIENELITDSRLDSNYLYDTLIHKWHHRFDCESDLSQWIGDTQLEWISELQSKGLTPEAIEKRKDIELGTLKLTFDNVFNMLIFFAVKHVIHELRVLFRACFQHKEDTNFIFFKLEPFGCTITVRKEDIPPPSHHHANQNITPHSKKRKSLDNAPTDATTNATSLTPLTTTTHTPTPTKQGSIPSTSKQPKHNASNVGHIMCNNDQKGCYKSNCPFKHVKTYSIICKHHLKEPGCFNLASNTCKLLHPLIMYPKPPTEPNPHIPPTNQSQKVRFTPNYQMEEGEANPPQGTSSNNPTPQVSTIINHNIFNTTCNTQCYVDSTQEQKELDSAHQTKPSKRRRKHRIHPADRRLALLRSLCHNITNIGVHVLHDCPVNEEEMLVLSLGLNFCPTPRKSKNYLLMEAMDKFSRQVRIKKHFASLLQDNTISNFSIEQILHLRINKSLSLEEAKEQFEPSITRSPIENYLTTIRNTLCPTQDNNNKNKPKQNRIWKAYYDIVKRLRLRNDIIIKPSDKNLGVTVMNRNWYITQALLQLNNENVYSPITNDPNLSDIINELKQIIATQTWLPKKVAMKLLKDLIIDYTLNRIKLCRIYFLPKLHKTPVGMRPICASQGWITYWTSVYIHMTILPLLKRIQSYISNSAQLVAMLDKIKPPEHFQFLEADVDNLYPSINIEEGLHALKDFLTTTGMHHTQVSLLVKLTRWVLTHNYVTFGENKYLQISGTAMGTPCAVVFACIFVHTIEREALNIFASTRYMIKCVFLFVRFIDDLIAIISDYDSGLDLMRLLNSRRKSIHFTFKIRNSEAQFLDLTLYKRITRHIQHLEVKAYSKPMNKFLYLPPTSCHPRHIFNGWIVGCCRRLRLNCSRDEDYNQVISDFKSHTTSRGYSDEFVQQAISSIPNRATIIDSTLYPKQKTSSIGVPFVITYSPEIQQALPAIRQALSLTQEANLDPHFPQIFGCRTTPLLSFKRGPNLRDLVAPSAIQTINQTPSNN